MSVVLQAEAPDGPASRALWAEYQALLEERLDAPVADPEHIFASPESFTGPGSAWLVPGQPCTNACSAWAESNSGKDHSPAQMPVAGRRSSHRLSPRVSHSRCTVR